MSDGAARDLAATVGPSGSIDLSDANAAWIQGRGVDVDHLVTLERLRHQRPDLVREAHSAVTKEGPKAAILRYMALNGKTATATYRDLDGVVSVAYRTIRKHVRELDEAGVLNREPLGNSTAVEWPNEAAYVISSELLDLFER